MDGLGIRCSCFWVFIILCLTPFFFIIFYLFVFVFKFFIQCLKVTFHLQLFQNICYIPCVVQYILVAYLTPNSLYLPALSTGNRQFVLYICECASLLLYSLVCCIFQIPHISDIIEYLSFSVWLILLSIMPCKSTHDAADGKISVFFMAVQYSIVCVCVCIHIYIHATSSLSIHLSVDIQVVYMSWLL